MIMRIFSLISLAFVLFAFTACQENVTEPEEIIIDSSQPQGAFVATESGTFVEQNDTDSAGTAELGTDEAGTSFLRFGDDFMTNLGTGTVTVYLSTSETFTPDPMNGNPDLRLIGPVSSNGENFFRLEAAAEARFTHVILWCGSANIPFGFAALN
jgi:hypothetical protein